MAIDTNRSEARHAASLVITAVATLLGFASATRAQTPANDPFYTPPSSLAGYQPGDIIRARTSVFTTDSVLHAPLAGVTAHQILYVSESAMDQLIAVSGTVLVPTSAWTDGRRPLISYAVGTKGMGDQCAPSYAFTQGTDYEGGPISTLVARGWAVVITDMEGLGVPGVHTYDVGWSQGKAVLNAARAALRLPSSGIDASPPIGIMGYSQGGNSSLWAAQLASSYAPELDIKGVVGGGAAVNLIATANYLNRTALLAPVLMAAAGYDAAYPELNLKAYLNDRGKMVLQTYRDICLVSFDGITNALGVGGQDINAYTSLDPLTTKPWQNRLNENKLGGLEPTAPVMLTHGYVDQINPYSTALELRRDWCDRGAVVDWRPYCAADHGVGAVSTFSDGVPFLVDRFAGKPTTGNCGDPSLENACGAGSLPPRSVLDPAGSADAGSDAAVSGDAGLADNGHGALFGGGAGHTADAGPGAVTADAADASPSATLDSASRSDAGNRGGCGCVVARPATRPAAGASLLLALGAAWAVRRRRR